MNREELKALGLSDEQIDSVMKSHGTVVNGMKEKADNADALQTQIDDYKIQLKERDDQLTTLSEKVKGNDDLTKQIEDLKTQNDVTKSDYEAKLNQQTLDSKLDMALLQSKARNTKAVKALLDLDAVKLDGDKLLGLEDQLKSLKESEPYQFETTEDAPKSPNIVTPGNPKGSVDGQKALKDYSYSELANLKETNPSQFEALTKNQ